MSPRTQARLPLAPLETRARARKIERGSVRVLPPIYTVRRTQSGDTRMQTHAGFYETPADLDSRINQERPMWTPSADLADIFGVSVRTIARWRDQGVPWPDADRCAIELDTHPVLVWGDDWLELDETTAIGGAS